MSEECKFRKEGYCGFLFQLRKGEKVTCSKSPIPFDSEKEARDFLQSKGYEKVQLVYPHRFAIADKDGVVQDCIKVKGLIAEEKEDEINRILEGVKEQIETLLNGGVSEPEYSDVSDSAETDKG